MQEQMRRELFNYSSQMVSLEYVKWSWAFKENETKDMKTTITTAGWEVPLSAAPCCSHPHP